MDDGRVVATRTPEVQVPSARTELQPRDDVEPAAEDDAADVEDWADADDRVWERPPARYRAGRGGFDAEAAALTARARYAFRQRVVLAMLVAAVATGVVAGVALPVLWWAHGAVDVLLVGYLVYLRRQVRLEEAIRARRAARMAGTRRPPAADDPELDEWAERGRAATRAAGATTSRRVDNERSEDVDGRRPGARRCRSAVARPRDRTRGRSPRRHVPTRRRGGAARPPAPAPDAAAPAARGHGAGRGRGRRSGPRRRRRSRLPPCGGPVGGC